MIESDIYSTFKQNKENEALELSVSKNAPGYNGYGEFGGEMSFHTPIGS